MIVGSWISVIDEILLKSALALTSLLTSMRTTVVTLANSKIVFVDFNDSFTHNILSYLYSWGEIEVIAATESSEYLKTHERFVWGPGPGMVHEYGIDFDLLRNSINNPTHRHFG